jgi:hypothetical protein
VVTTAGTATAAVVVIEMSSAFANENIDNNAIDDISVFFIKIICVRQAK